MYIFIYPILVYQRDVIGDNPVTIEHTIYNLLDYSAKYLSKAETELVRIENKQHTKNVNSNLIFIVIK